jgi:hypothetical protein
VARFALLLLAVPLVVAACGGGGGSAASSSPSGSTQSATPAGGLIWKRAAPKTAAGRAAAKTEAGGHQAVTVKGTIVSSDTSSIEGRGTYATPDSTKLALTVRTPVTGAVVDMNQVFQGSTLYLRSNALDSYASGDRWLSLDLGKAPADPYGNEAPLPFTTVDPQLTLDTLRAATSEQTVGPGHYRVVIAPALARKLALGPWAASLDRQTLDAFVGKDGKVAKVVSKARYLTGGTPRPIEITLTTAFAPGTGAVTAPAASVKDRTSQAVSVFRDSYTKATVPG